jgi:hypothetical protein
MDISILISSIRPHMVRDVINAINSVSTSYKYEILLYSDRHVDLPNVKCIVYDKLDTTVNAYNMLYRESLGNCIIAFVDDYIPQGYWPGIYDELKSALFKDRKVKMIHCPADPRQDTVFLNQISPVKFDLLNECRVPHFHCFLRDSIESVLGGVIHNESFRHHYVDIWLGAYLAYLGENTISSKQCWIKASGRHTNDRYDNHDEMVCIELLNLIKSGVKIDYNHSINVGLGSLR